MKTMIKKSIQDKIIRAVRTRLPEEQQLREILQRLGVEIGKGIMESLSPNEKKYIELYPDDYKTMSCVMRHSRWDSYTDSKITKHLMSSHAFDIALVHPDGEETFPYVMNGNLLSNLKGELPGVYKKVHLDLAKVFNIKETIDKKITALENILAEPECTLTMLKKNYKELYDIAKGVN